MLCPLYDRKVKTLNKNFCIKVFDVQIHNPLEFTDFYQKLNLSF